MTQGVSNVIIVQQLKYFRN